MSGFVKRTERDEKESKEYLLNLDKIKLEEEFLEGSIYDCINITKVEIGKNVKIIGDWYFSECHTIQEVTIHPENKNFYIDNDRLMHRETKTMVLCYTEPHIPDDVTTINMCCFTKKDDVENFYIGKSLETIVTSARCFNIKNIILSPENKNFVLEGNCLFAKGNDEILLGCENSIMPERTTSINICAFESCGIKKVILPKKIITLKNHCFEACKNLEQVILNDGLKSLGKGVFYNCLRLKELNLPKSVTIIGENSFYNCKNLKQIKSFGGVKKINGNLFTDSGLESIEIPPQIQILDTNAFRNCEKLKEVIISDGVLKIGSGAFINCINLKKITMENSVTELGDDLFYNCESLEEVKLSSKIKEIPMKCFMNCKSLTEINLPIGLERIDSWAFDSCGKLENINFTELTNIKKIMKDAFTNCKRLKYSPIVKKKPQLPNKLYLELSYDEIKKDKKTGDKIEFVKESMVETTVVLNNAFELKGKKYVFVHRKGMDCFVAITDIKMVHPYYKEKILYKCNSINTDNEKFAALHEAMITLKK